MEYEIKHNSGYITECKQIERNGIPVGIIKGYIATWDIDRGNDRFVKGAFSEHLGEYMTRGRAIRMKSQHNRVIGAIPIDTVREDEKGLYTDGAEINLETQEGRETYSLARQKALTDWSIGYKAVDWEYQDGVRVIKKSKVWEGSIVDEPMNQNAEITEVKVVNSRATLPKEFADRAMKWDATAAEKRVRSWAGGEAPNEKYKKAFLWYDSENEENYTAYKLQIADIVDGALKIVPRAVFAVRAVLSGARGGVNIPSSDKTKITGIVNALYKEMDMDEPSENGKMKPFCITEIKCMSKSLLSGVFRYCELSKDAADYAASNLMSSELDDDTGESVKALNEIVAKLKSTKETLNV